MAIVRNGFSRRRDKARILGKAGLITPKPGRPPYAFSAQGEPNQKGGNRMKRKIAAAIAAIMAFASVLPATGVFGAAGNGVTQPFASYGDGTLVYPLGFTPYQYGSWDYVNQIGQKLEIKGSAADQLQRRNGGFIDVPLSTTAAAGASGTFTVDLNNAKWALFDQTANGGSLATVVGAGTGGAAPVVYYNGGATAGFVLSFGVPGTIVASNPTSADQLPYKLEINPARQNSVTISYNNVGAFNWDKDDYFHIPVSVITGGTGPVTVSAYTTGAPEVDDKLNMSLGYNGRTTQTTTSEILEAQEGEATLNPILISEVSYGTLNNGTFYIDAPEGFQFVNTLAQDITVEGDDYRFDGVQVPGGSYEVMFTANTDYIAGSTGVFGRIVVRLTGIQPSFGAAYGGSYIIVKGIKVKAIDGYTLNQNLPITISSADGERYPAGAVVSDILAASHGMETFNGGTNIQKETVNVVKFIASDVYGISYTAGTPTTTKAGYRAQRAATVHMAEKKGNSWWAYRDTTFTLADKDGNPLDNVRFTDVYITNKTELASAVDANNSPIGNFGNQHYINNDGNNTGVGGDTPADRNGYYPASNRFRLAQLAQTNAQREDAKKASFDITAFISPDINFEGDVYLKLESDDYRFAQAGYVDPSNLVKIAEVKRVVTAVADTTNVQIGSQRINVGDVTITELIKGGIVSDKFKFTVGQYGNAQYGSAIYFVPTSGKVDITSGNIKVSRDGAADVFKVDSKSTEESTIKISGLQVNIDRTVPYGTYELAISGLALRDNGYHDYDSTGSGSYLGKFSTYDYFDNTGLVTDKYINVATEPSNNPFNSKIVVANNDSTAILVNGEAKEMGAATKNVNDRLYVPIRFLANALGARDADIVWSDLTQTAAVRLNSEQVVFTVDSSVYKVNGVSLGLAEGCTDLLIDGYNYISVRAFAEAFNIELVWDAEKGEAILNPTASDIARIGAL
jgi:hypothetical protein